MEQGRGTKAKQGGRLKKLLVPTAVGVVGSALAVALTKKPDRLKQAIPEPVAEVVPKIRDAMSEGIGEITDDLRGRLDSVLGKGEEDGGELEGFEGQMPRRFDSSKFEQRRAERRKRREGRRRRAA
jgi:hypothetical protein